MSDKTYTHRVIAATSFYTKLFNVTKTIPNSEILFRQVDFQPVFWMNIRLNELSQSHHEIRFQDSELEMIDRSVEEAFQQHLQDLSNSNKKDHVFRKIIHYLCKQLQTQVNLLLEE